MAVAYFNNVKKTLSVPLAPPQLCKSPSSLDPAKLRHSPSESKTITLIKPSEICKSICYAKSDADKTPTLADRKMQLNMANHEKPLQQTTEAQTEQWDALWRQKTTPWDRAAPNSALIDALNERSDILGSSIQSGETRRRTALIPGCGRGYDVLLFASHGYDAYGLDISQTAVEACRELDAEQGNDDTRYPLKATTAGRGLREFLVADFFNDDLSSHTNGSGFDIIYDFTFLCAIPPELRPQWAKRMSELLAPNGSLICLEFPLAKPPKAGGPPHGLSSELYLQLFKQPGREVGYAEDGYVAPDERSLDRSSGLVRVAHWSQEGTQDLGTETQMMSIWQHAQSV